MFCNELMQYKLRNRPMKTKLRDKNIFYSIILWMSIITCCRPLFSIEQSMHTTSRLMDQKDGYFTLRISSIIKVAKPPNGVSDLR